MSTQKTSLWTAGHVKHDKSGPDSKEQSENQTLKPALVELGTALCPVCKRRVTVFVTKTKRPFINCGFCSARVFYNGSRSIRLIQHQMKKAKKGSGL